MSSPTGPDPRPFPPGEYDVELVSETFEPGPEIGWTIAGTMDPPPGHVYGYRRDAVDKILRDKVRRGQPPDLQLCGQIAAMLGLLVTGAKVPAASATRLITPCLVPWKEGFAIATASNAAGLRLASPAEGWVQLSPAQIAERNG